MISLFIYLLFPIICFFISFIKTKYKFNHERIIYKFFDYTFLLIVIVFICCSYMTGVDWIEYERLYNVIGTNGYHHYFEPAYLLLNYFFYNIDTDFWCFLILLKIFCFICLLILINKFSKNKWFSLSYLLTSGLYCMFLEPLIRNMIGLSLFWLSTVLYVKNYKKLAWFILLLSPLFHLSMILVIIFIFYLYLLNKLNLKGKIVLFFLFYLMLSSYDFLTLIVVKSSELLGFGLKKYFISEAYRGSFISITSLISLIFFIFAFINRKILYLKIKNANLIILFSSVYILCSRLTATIPVFSRMSYAFLPFYVFILYFIISEVISKNLLTKYFLIAIVIAFNLLFTFNFLIKNNKYIPYSNYLYYQVMQIDIPYSIRVDYTRKHYPFKKPD